MGLYRTDLMIGEGQSDRVTADGGTVFVTERDTEESTARAVSRSLAAIRGVSETDLDPLYPEIDFEAVDRMIDHADEHDCDVTTAFTIDGYEVLVQTDGTIRITADSHLDR